MSLQRLATKGIGRQWLVGLDLDETESAPLDLCMAPAASPFLPPPDIPGISVDQILAQHGRPT